MSLAKCDSITIFTIIFIFFNMDIFKKERKSFMDFNEVYFYTATIYEWKHLLKPDKYKELIIESLWTLYERECIKVYGFVIMPNHIHLLWELLKKNGKENPQASFLKYLSHAIHEDLKKNHPQVLQQFYVNESDRDYRYWLHDPLAVKIHSKEMAEQKLDYIHNNPLQSHWNLALTPEEYKYSSAGFYLQEKREFVFLSDYRERL